MNGYELNLLTNLLVVGAILFGLGIMGFICRRNMIVMFLAAEMMLQGVSLSLVAWGRYYNNFDGQVLVIFIIAVAACEAALAMALILMLFHRRDQLDVAIWQQLRESNVPERVDPTSPEGPPPAPSWPTLPVAGVEPEIPREKTEYRRHV